MAKLKRSNFKFFQFFSAQNANFLFEFSTEFSATPETVQASDDQASDGETRD